MLPFRPVRGRPYGRARSRTRALAVALLAALLGGLLPVAAAGTAHAAGRTVAGGRLDWAVKSSFQTYVTGPIAKGSWSLNGGAATVGESRFRFHSATGSYDPDTGALTAGFSGGVHFTGHRKPDGSHELDLTISRPRVTVSGGSGTLYADMTSKEKGSGRVTSAAQVPLATLNLSGLDMRGGGSPIALNNVPATLTSQGAKAFAGYYPAGTALDPVSLSADVKGPDAAKSPDADRDKGKGEDTEGDDAKDKGRQDDAGRPAGDFADAAVDWGVRRTFREYVTGDIAQGRWQLTDGAQDGGALFRFPKGKGSYDPEKATLDARFAGTLRFTGKHLDLALSKVGVTVEDGKGTLTAQVKTPQATTDRAPLATFEAKQLKPEDGLIALSEAPARLTEEGAKAFGGMYKAGTAMDPVSLAVAVDAKAKLPALPDLGSDPGASASPEQPSAKDKKGTVATASASSSSGFPVLPLSLAAGALVLAGAAFLVLRARRRTHTPPQD